MRKNNRRHLDKEIPFGESEIDCDATKTPACVADICVGVADSSIEEIKIAGMRFNVGIYYI